ncbi:MAG: SDR family NAD(P)-dependent oxidoreductase, partial [Gammaproteobacteria bacterium]
FRYMAQARHTGKIVLTIDNPRVAARTVRQDGTYLVTGGLGALGLEVAKSLASRGARHIALLGRSAPNSRVTEVVEGLQQDGAEVRVLSADVSDAASLAAALSEIRAALPPLVGVLHAAGVIDDGVIHQQSWRRFERVLAPKVAGAWNLHAATQSDPLDLFVLFSAASGVLGSPGQGSYAAGNVFLDTLAHFRRRQGQPATSIDWGAWKGSGMTESADAVRSLSARGLQLMSAAQGVDALWRTLAENPVQRVVLPIDWRRFRERSGNGGAPLLAECFAAMAAPAGAANLSGNTTTADFAARVSEAAPQARSRIVMDLVLTHIRKAIGLASDQPIDERQPLQELGLDSLMAVDLRNSLAAATGRQLPATFAFDYPMPESIARHLLSLLQPRAEPVTPLPVRPPKAAAPVVDADIAALSDDEAADLLLQELAEIAKR